MENKLDFDSFLDNIEPYLILVIITSFVGVVGGVFGALFLKLIDLSVSFGSIFYYFFLLMPVIGIIIVYLNRKFKCDVSEVTSVRNAIIKKKNIPSFTFPVIFTSTTLSHLSGASVGMMETPVLMGGSVGDYISNFFGLKNRYRNTVIACGVSAFFSAIFGTPLTATIFAYELCLSKENAKTIFILPVLLAAAFSRFICFAFGLNSFVDRILYIHHASFNIKDIAFILILIVVCTIFALFFNYIFDFSKKLFNKISNEYLRIIIGSIMMICFIYFTNTTLFSSNNTDLIEKVLNNNSSMWYVSFVKCILTAICIAAGFKGGNIGPSFICGSCFGILVASLMGIDPIMGACIGAICLFSSVTTFYISSVFLGIEIFGISNICFYIIVVIIVRYLVNKDYIKSSY